MRITASAVVLVLASLSAASAARAETTGCTVLPTLPATISIPGHYCLEANTTVAGSAVNGITIGASDVVLDCNDHAITATAADNSGAGVRVGGDTRRVTVRNCRIVGFTHGIAVNSMGPTAQARAMQVLGNRIEGPMLVGILLNGSGNLIEGNHVSGVRGGVGQHPTGIYLENVDTAAGNVIRGNAIVDFRPTYSPPTGFALSIGVLANYQQGLVVEDNTVLGLHGRTGGGVYGISTANSTDGTLRNNRVLAVEPGAPPLDGGNWYGIFVQGTAEVAGTNRCIDNLVGHFITNFSGCSATGNPSF